MWQHRDPSQMTSTDRNSTAKSIVNSSSLKKKRPVLPHFAHSSKRCVARSRSVARFSPKFHKRAQMNETKKSNVLLFRPFINFRVPLTFFGGKPMKKGEKGNPIKANKWRGWAARIKSRDHHRSINGNPPRAHTEKGEKTFDDSILLCRVSSIFLFFLKKNVERPLSADQKQFF
jgi:hypothetical protein